MITLDSSIIEGYRNTFDETQKLLQSEEFDLGGGYTYEHGYFDHALDWENVHQGFRYYLRIPALAVDGNMDDPKTMVELGKPFVIKHEFLTTNDPGVEGEMMGLMNQFSEPIPTEGAHIDERWVLRARDLVERVEQRIQGIVTE